MDDVLKIIIFSFVAVLALFLLSKILGKKQIAQLEFVDYVTGISIGSIAAEMATDLQENPFWHYLIAMGIFFLFDLAITFFGRKGAFLKKFLIGRPLVIIDDGKISYKELKKSKLDVNELISMCRSKGIFNINEVAYAILENSGELSILPKREYTPTVVKDFEIKKNKTKLIENLIVDGKIVEKSLKTIDKNEKWLKNELKIKTKADLKNILLAFYDEQTKKVMAYYKNK